MFLTFMHLNSNGIITCVNCSISFLFENGRRGGSRGRVQRVRTPPPLPDDLRFSNTTGILPKKKLCGLLVLK